MENDKKKSYSETAYLFKCHCQRKMKGEFGQFNNLHRAIREFKPTYTESSDILRRKKQGQE